MQPTPWDGVKLFAVRWNTISRRLLSDDAHKWDVTKDGSPKDAQKAIAQFETGVFFSTAARNAEQNKGELPRDAFLEKWITGENDTFGVSEKAFKTPAYAVYREKMTRRVRASFKREMGVLVRFGLFKKVSPSAFRITDLGKSLLEELDS